MELLLVCLWLKLDVLIVWSIIIAIVAFFVGVLIPTVALFTQGDSLNPERWMQVHGPLWKARRNLGLKIFIPFLLFSMLVPSSKDTAILVASSVAIDVAKSPEGAKIGQLLRGKANEILDKEISKLSTQVVK